MAPVFDFSLTRALSLLWPLAVTSIPGGCGPLHDVGIEVSLGWVGSPMRRVVDVQFFFFESGDCFVIPEGTQVSLNGVPLRLALRGKKISDTSRFLRIAIPAPTCQPALFRSEPFGSEPPGGIDRIDVEMLGKKAVVEVAGLRAQRSLRLVSGPLVPGRDATLEWVPPSDVWPDEIVGAEVRIDGGDIARIVISDSALRAEDGRFNFRVPSLRPGPVTLSVLSGSKRPLVRVTKCRAFRECNGGEIDGPPPLQTDVVAPGPGS